MKIGIIREGKIPPDARVPMVPEQCARIQRLYPVQVVVEPSPVRCIKDEEFEQENISLQTDLSDCDLIMGVKEVPVDWLKPNKTYLFFSHTIKKQAYNRKLLQTILERKIRLIDYEVITDDRGLRVIAFGYFAGVVGAYNGILTYGRRSGAFDLKRLRDCHDYAEACEQFKGIAWPPFRIVLTGTGRVSSGAVQVLRDMGIRELSPEVYLNESFNEAVFTQLSCRHYVKRKDGADFSSADFYQHPEAFESAFEPYTRVTDIFINGIFWDKRAPTFFTKEDMRNKDFNIKVIADVTCDIGPDSSVPCTIRATTIADPIMGYDPFTESETAPHQAHVIDLMSIDNLPSELPRDASTAFGEMFITYVLPELLKEDSPFVERATIAAEGKLMPRFAYLQDYVNGG